MYKNIVHKDEMTTKIQEGVASIAAIVARTLGPGGLPILIERAGQSLNGDPLGPMITKDGVTVASECSSDDPEVDVVIQAVKAICQKTNRVAGDGPQPLYSKVLTPKGFVEMGDVEVGMEICGVDGTFQTILGVFPKGEKEIYEIEFSNGRTVECCSEHLWTVINTGTMNNIKETKTTKELFADYIKCNEKGEFRSRYYVPRTSVDFHENKDEMPLDPYLVGVLLGDGSLSGTGSIELSLGIKKEHILKNLKLPEGIYLNTSFVPEKNYFRVKIYGKDNNGKSIADIVKSIGLLGTKSDTKFIPKSYLYSSKQTRQSLLQGLLDTDGHINSRGLFEFSSVSKELAENTAELARSLGRTINLYISERKLEKSYSMKPIYKLIELKGYKYGDKIVKITPTYKKTKMQCIKVSNPDNLYITDNYIVTHNTTTAIVLGKAILKEAYNIIEYEGTNPQTVRASLEEAALEVEAELKKLATPCKDNNMIKHVATISANGDTSIGEVISSAFKAVGAEGSITVDEGGGKDHTLEIINGFQIRRGAEAQDRFFNNSEKTKFEAENCHVVLYDGKLQQASQVINVLKILFEKYQGKMPPVLFMANEFTIEAIQCMLINRAEGGLSLCAVKNPHQTKVTTAMLDDMAIFMGGERLGNGNRNLNNVEFEDIGIVDKVVVDKYTATFMGGHGEETAVINRIDQLKAQRAEAESPYDAALISDRIAALAEGVAKIGVGGLTDLEVKEKYHRIEDAVNAARAAVEEGVIPGGGATLYRIANDMDETTIGRRILKAALRAPLYQILNNLGITGDAADVIAVSLEPNKHTTYDGVNMAIVYAIEAGIIDPVKVTRTAFANAISIASLMSTCGGAITFKRK